MPKAKRNRRRLPRQSCDLITSEIDDEHARFNGLIRALSAIIHKEAQATPKKYPQMGTDVAAIELVLAKDVAGNIISRAGGEWDFESYRPGRSATAPHQIGGRIALKDVPFEAIKTLAENEASNFVDYNDPSNPVAIPGN